MNTPPRQVMSLCDSGRLPHTQYRLIEGNPPGYRASEELVVSVIEGGSPFASIRVKPGQVLHIQVLGHQEVGKP